MPNNQSGGTHRNSSSLAYQKARFRGAYNASRGPPPQPHVVQSYSPRDYSELNKVNKKVNDMEMMTRELKESNERMMKIMSKQFTPLAMSNRGKGVFPSQPEENPRRGGSSSLFNPSDFRKLNVVISLWSGKKG